MWGRKAKRIAELERQHALDQAIADDLRVALATESEIGQTLMARCSSLAEELRAAQNALLVEADQNGIRAEAIAHVREVIAVAGMGLCTDCDPDVDVHLDHTQESGCPVEGCVCLIRDSDPPATAPERAP